MLAIVYDWKLTVENGGSWLFVKVGRPAGKPWEMPPLAETVRSVLERSSATGLVLELGEIRFLSSDLIGQFLALDKWVRDRGGTLRLCGLSRHNLDRLRSCRLAEVLPLCQDRPEAVDGCQGVCLSR